MSKKGRPRGVKNERGLHTVAIPKELSDQLRELAEGSGMSLTGVASYILTKGLERVQIVEETITRKRLLVE